MGKVEKGEGMSKGGQYGEIHTRNCLSEIHHCV